MRQRHLGRSAAKRPTGVVTGHNDQMSQSSLTDQLKADLTTAMKARDQVATSTLRMLIAAVRNAEVAGDQARSLDDDEVIGVLQSEAKKRSEAAEVYAEAGRTQSAEDELAELAIIDRYLPAKMSDEELTAIVDEEIARIGSESDQPSGPKLMGPVIAAVRARVGAAADGGTISGIVKRQLTG